MARERESTARSSMREAARRRAEETSHGGSGFSVSLPEGVNFFKNDGKTVEFDFIPYVISNPLNVDVRAGRKHVGDLEEVCAYKRHGDIGAEQKMYICPTTIGKPCPICEAHAAAKKKSTMSKEEVDALRAKDRMLYNVIDVNDKEGKVMVWDVSYHLFTKQLEHEQRENEEYYGFADPDEGHTLRIRFEKRTIGRGEPFWEADRIDFTKRNPLSDADLKAAVDLDACLQILDYKQLEAIFLGIDGDVDNEPESGGPARPAADRGRGREAAAPAAAESTRGRRAEAPPAEQARGRREPAPAAEPARARRGGSEDSIHNRQPDAPEERSRHEAEAGKHAVDPDQDCPGGGKFGEDTDKLDHCDRCEDPKWKACRAEKDGRAKATKAATAPAPPAEQRGGRRR